MSNTRMTCKSYCELWNDIDKDCEAYGENHPCPRKCPLFLKRHKIARNCCVCGKVLPDEKDQFVYFDSANSAITKSMAKKVFCKDCYTERWGL